MENVLNQNSNKDDLYYKMMIIGSKYVGKTHILKRFCKSGGSYFYGIARPLLGGGVDSFLSVSYNHYDKNNWDLYLSSYLLSCPHYGE